MDFSNKEKIEERINEIEEKQMYYKLKRFEKKELKLLRKKLNQIKEGKNKNEEFPDEEIIEEEKEEEKIYFNEYIENHKVNEYEQIPQYMEEKEDNSNLVKNCGKIINKFDFDLSIIIMEDNFHSKFCDFLDKYIKYEEYKIIYLLKDKLIISKNKIKDYKILHKELDNSENTDNIFIAETISISNIDLYNQKEVNELIKNISIMSNKFKNDFIGEIQNWVRTVFNIISEYILFNSKDTPIYYCCDKCKRPIIYIEKNYIEEKVEEKELNNNIIKEIKPEIIEKKKEKKIKKEKKNYR